MWANKTLIKYSLTYSPQCLNLKAYYAMFRMLCPGAQGISSGHLIQPFLSTLNESKNDNDFIFNNTVYLMILRVK